VHESTLLAAATWRKSTNSGDGGCVEVAMVSGVAVGVRDSKNPTSGYLVFAPSEWSAFLAGVKHGEFDLID
jgi:Domain of unknown function (DUF397)